MWSRESRVRPSEEKMISFWVRERVIRSRVRGQLVVGVRDFGESQPDQKGMLVCVLERTLEYE